jgi:pimeloyl-ACP methyl ester carboxylesterase
MSSNGSDKRPTSASVKRPAAGTPRTSFFAWVLMITGALVVVLGVGLSWAINEFGSSRHSPSSIRVLKPKVDADDLNGDYIQNKQKLWLYTKTFKGRGKNRGVVFLLHGLGEHIKRSGYLRLFDLLQSNGYTVYTHEHVGHGRSDGDRAHVAAVQDYVDDALAYHQSVINKLRGSTTIFLMGHSMGSLIALQCIRQKPEVPPARRLPSRLRVLSLSRPQNLF